MKREDIKEAGRIGALQQKFSDEELKLAIKGTELVISYLEGSGDSKALLYMLRMRLITLIGFEEARKKWK